ncbi:hypothetical protein [Mycobacterium sp. 1245805.9]|nr:hypothetical protein [Mycobacterium sp. 1245805.9]
MTDDEYADYVKRLVDRAPSLRPDQVVRLSSLFDAPRLEQNPSAKAR